MLYASGEQLHQDDVTGMPHRVELTTRLLPVCGPCWKALCCTVCGHAGASSWSLDGFGDETALLQDARADERQVCRHQLPW